MDFRIHSDTSQVIVEDRVKNSLREGYRIVACKTATDRVSGKVEKTVFMAKEN